MNFKKEYGDPIAHFSAVAEEMDKERRAKNIITVTLDMTESVDRSSANRNNYGHIVFSKIYHELEIDWFLKNARRHEYFHFNTEYEDRADMLECLMNEIIPHVPSKSGEESYELEMEYKEAIIYERSMSYGL